MPITAPWNLDDALDFMRILVEPLKEKGWGLALGGSVPVKGSSDNDLDLVIFPLDKSNTPPHASFRKVLLDAGLELKWSPWEIQKFWQRQASSDTKHVEVWFLGDRRVDVFVLS